mgnify:CR=1 FL=1
MGGMELCAVVATTCPTCEGTGEIDAFDGKAFRQWRRGRGLSLWQVAYVARISLPYLSEIERGNKRPSEEVAQRLEWAKENIAWGN